MGEVHHPMASHFALAKNHSMAVVSSQSNLRVFNLQKDSLTKSRVAGRASSALNAITHERAITCVAVNTAKNLIAFGDKRGAIMIYHPSGSHSLLHWHPVTCTSIDFSTDGNYLYSVANDGVMCMWNVSKGTRMSHFPCGQPLNFVTVSPKQDSCLIVTAGNQVLKIDLHGNKDKFNVQGILAHRNPMRVPLQLAVHPTSGEVSITGSNVLQWYDIDNDRETKRSIIQYKALTYNPSRFNKTEPLTHVITHTAISGSGTRVATCERINDQTCLKFWHNTKFKCESLSVVDTPHSANITSCAFNQASRANNMCVTTSLDGTAKLWNRSGDMEHHVCYAIVDYRRLKPLCATFSIDGHSVIIGFERLVTVWDAKSATLVLVEDFTDGQYIRSIHCLDDSHIIVQTGNCVYIYSLVKARIVWSIDMKETISRFAFHLNSRQMAMKLRSTVHVFTVPKKDVSATSRTHVSSCTVPVEAINFSNKGQLLILTRQFDLLTFKGEATEKVDGDRAKLLVEIPDTELLAKASQGQVLLDETSKQKKQKQQQLNPDAIVTTAFDPELGMNAWKDIFGGHSSHQLMSMNDCFGTYMNTFLLKSDLHKASQRKEEEEQSAQHASASATAADHFKHRDGVVGQLEQRLAQVQLSDDMCHVLGTLATQL